MSGLLEFAKYLAKCCWGIWHLQHRHALGQIDGRTSACYVLLVRPACVVHHDLCRRHTADGAIQRGRRSTCRCLAIHGGHGVAIFLEEVSWWHTHRLGWLSLGHPKGLLGVNANRSRWLVSWLGRTLEADGVNLADFSAVLGRLSFAFAALEPLRPFLGPLYAWVGAVSDRCARLALPKAVRLVMKYVLKMLEGGHNLQSVGSKQRVYRELFRTDAKADGESVCVGGWAVADGTDTKACRWFSEQLTRENAPWAFIAGEPFRAIASLEMLATLAAMVVFGLKTDACGAIMCSAATDNLGNACVMKRLLTTKFPLVAFLMEIAARLILASAELRLDWTPRLQNREAGALTNGDFRDFHPDRRVRFDLDLFEDVVLRDMLEAGVDLYEDIRAARAKCAKKGVQPVKLQKAVPLRQRDPWQ